MENVTTDDKLAVLFYLLIRDHLPVGVVEKLVQSLEVDRLTERIILSNKYLAEYAIKLSDRIYTSGRDL